MYIRSGAACVVTVTIPDDATDETLILYLVSKALLSASFLIIYPFAGELYPTQVRGIGIGASSYIGGLGLIVIPFVTYLVRSSVLDSFYVRYYEKKYSFVKSKVKTPRFLFYDRAFPVYNNFLGFTKHPNHNNYYLFSAKRCFLATQQ